jgi:tryptophan-rich sensory protein
MPILAWVAIIAMIGYSSSLLWRSLTRREVRYGPIVYARNEEPIYYWFFVTLFVGCEIFLVGLIIMLIRA